MKTVIIFDHPYTAAASHNVPHQRAFLAALCQQVQQQLKAQNDQVTLIDLHAEQFDPVMSAAELARWRQGLPVNTQAARYQQTLLAAERIIFMFPIWWEVMPAMTKGFLDKVYAKNILYRGDNMHTKLERQPRIDVITTMSTPKLLYRWLFGAPLLKMLQRGTFLKTRLWHFKWHSVAQVDQLTLAQRQQVLAKFKI
jgi:putative NADPH-quinone reductase